MNAENDLKFETVSGTSLDRLHKKSLQDIRAVATPFPTWNVICGEEGGKIGPAMGWVIVVGGVTGTGKSYFAQNLSAAAVQDGHRVGMVNFEMSQMAVTVRHLAILTGLPKFKLEQGDNFDSKVWEQAQREADRILAEKGGVLITNESSVFSLPDIEQSYKKLTDAGVSMIIVDYAQLVTVPGVEGIYARSEAVATKLRELTHKYKVVTIAVSQFNREEARRNKKPSIHGLMGGGIWEHAANQIVLLNHTLRYRYGTDSRGKPYGEYTELIFGKNRHGFAPVELPVKWSYRSMRFEEYVPGTDPDDPFTSGGENEIIVDAPAKKSDDAETGELFDDF